MGGVFWSRLTPQEEMAKARDILEDLVRSLRRASSRLAVKRENMTALCSNAVDAGDKPLARSYAESAVAFRALMILYNRRANDIQLKLAGLDEQNMFVVMAEVNSFMNRAIARVVGNKSLEEFQHDLLRQQKNLEVLRMRDEDARDNLAIGDDGADDLDIMDHNSASFKEEVDAMVESPVDNMMDSLMDTAPVMDDVRRHRRRSNATLHPPVSSAPRAKK